MTSLHVVQYSSIFLSVCSTQTAGCDLSSSSDDWFLIFTLLSLHCLVSFITVSARLILTIGAIEYGLLPVCRIIRAAGLTKLLVQIIRRGEFLHQDHSFHKEALYKTTQATIRDDKLFSAKRTFHLVSRQFVLTPSFNAFQAESMKTRK